MTVLTPAESIALTMARAQVERGDRDNVTAMLVWTIDRLAAQADEIRAVHHPVGLDLGALLAGVHCAVCEDDTDWPCQTVRILDAYVGSNDD